MKTILDRTKSKAETYAPSTAPKGTFPSPFNFRPFRLEFQNCLLCKALRHQPPFDARFGHERSLLPTAFYVVSIKATMSALCQKRTFCAVVKNVAVPSRRRRPQVAPAAQSARAARFYEATNE
jgi:hypothetical protein